MRRSLRALLPTLVLLATLTTVVFGQHTMFVPRPTTTTYIEDVILGDTLASGARKDSLRVYVLQRGGTWFWRNTIQNVGWKLTIQAADTGSGAMPKIYGRPTPGTTTVPYNFVKMEGPLLIKGLMICGYLDADTSALNTYQAPGQFFSRSNPNPDREEFIGNVFSGPLQAYVSAFGSCSVIKMVDNIFANDGVPPLWDLGNGRIADLRNVSLDSLILVNNTLAYGFDRAIRHAKSVGRVDVFLIDHNTIYENGGRYGLLSLGAVGSKVQITNNLLIDPMAFGADTSMYRQSDFREAAEFDAQGKVKMTWIYHMSGANDSLPGKKATAWNIAHNYWYVTPQIAAVWDSCKKQGWDPALSMGTTLSDTIKSRVADTANAFIHLSNFAFTKVPAPMTSVVLYTTMPAPNGTGGQSSGGVWVGYDRRLINYYKDTMDCSYSTSSPAYTGAWGGFPVGDLNWFPTKKSQWLTTDVPAATRGIAETYTLSQNYPNPFNPTTEISFTVPKAGNVELTVFNMLGQKVATLLNGNVAAGQHNVTFNAANLASGVYFYRLEAGNHVSTMKMMLIK